MPSSGLSVGALNAVALAEVLQAGEDSREGAVSKVTVIPFQFALDPHNAMRDSATSRLVARAKRLREFIDAANRAPEQLVRALLPDAYQIDDVASRWHRCASRDSIPESASSAAEFVASRAGLARLYNQILDLPFSIGQPLPRSFGVCSASGQRSSYPRKAAPCSSSPVSPFACGC